MKSFLKNRWFLLLLRFVVGGVFLYAGILKLKDPQAFADSIATFQILPPIAINLVALVLPPLEILAGGMVILGLSVARAASALAILTGVFIFALLQAGVRGLEVDCGCFGGREPSVWTPWLALMRNGFILAGCWWLGRSLRKSEESKNFGLAGTAEERSVNKLPLRERFQRKVVVPEKTFAARKISNPRTFWQICLTKLH